jgi:hypothetical protein
MRHARRGPKRERQQPPSASSQTSHRRVYGAKHGWRHAEPALDPCANRAGRRQTHSSRDRLDRHGLRQEQPGRVEPQCLDQARRRLMHDRDELSVEGPLAEPRALCKGGQSFGAKPDNRRINDTHADPHASVPAHWPSRRAAWKLQTSDAMRCWRNAVGPPPGSARARKRILKTVAGM